MKVCSGITRTVFLIGNYAIKVPRLRVPWMWMHRVQGLLANLVEANIWRGYRSVAAAERICPVVWISWGGFVLVMRRCEPLHRDVLPEEQWPFTTDHKSENYGTLNGKVVCLDYA